LPPLAAGPGIAVLREFKSPVERDWGISSFSALAASPLKLPEAPDHDGFPDYSEEPAPRTENTEKTLTNFPRGALAGTFFHKLFEELDFSNSAYVEELTAKKLSQYGFAGEWVTPVSAMARNVLAADLDGSGMRLASVSNSERLNELGFYIPLNRISPGSLKTIFARFSGEACAYSSGFPERLGNLHFEPRRGFMRGFIDLVFSHERRFYLVDWKSNFLGHRPGDYTIPRISASMEEHFYYLQYHLYCLALHKYLKLRVRDYSYENNFGGVFYVYLRAFGKPGNSGIFRDRPGKALIEALEKELTRAGENGGFE
jgi:exodeoxyribonuclease V beta subunit